MVQVQQSREQKLDEIISKWEIHEVMMRYARGVNRMDPELVASCFHPDAWEDHGSYRGESMPFASHFTPGVFRTFKSMFHHIGNELIEIDGDRAAMEAYFIGCHRYTVDGVDKDMFFGGRYLSLFERRNGGPWLIGDRTVVHDWSRVDAIEEAWTGAGPFMQGTQGPADAVFHVLDRDRQRRPVL